MRLISVTTVPARRLFILCCLTVFSSDQLFAQASSAGSATNELKKLSVEQLMDIEVSLVSRGAEAVGRAPAAIAVVTNEDIKRSGATSVPEALRLVPGIHVARQTSNAWAVSSRGFSNRNSEKLLVLSDTRSLYTPLFSGVLWDVQDYLLEDIDRIEVVRGPGATLWGANAVNGVINVTTKSARNTQGLYVDASAGNEEQFAAAARYGGQIAENSHYRVFAKYVDRDATFHPTVASPDEWQLGHVGGRTDWETRPGESVTIQGELYRGTVGLVSPSITVGTRPSPQGNLETKVAGGNVLARWRRSTSNDSDIQVRAYYDRTHRDDPSFNDDLDTVDVDLQHRFALAARHDVTWGSNYRFTANRNEGKGVFALDPPSSRDHLIAGFIQDQIRILDSVRVTAGTKVEHNDFSGVEVQPSGRVAWDISSHHIAWGAVSRAVRVPTRLERDTAIDTSNPAASTVVRLVGNQDFESERLVAYEAGYRWQPRQSLFIDAAAFHNRYNGLASLEFADRFVDGSGRTIVPIINRNLTDAHAQGLEATVTFDPVQTWRVSASSSTLALTIDHNGADLNRGRFFDGATPRHQLGVRSSFDLTPSLQFDAMFRHLTRLRRLPPIMDETGIDGYAELDLRLAWRVSAQLELSLVGQNLLHDHHVEFGSVTTRGEIERSAYAKIAWAF